MPKLTQKQENFVQAYFRTGNQYQAYCEAYDAEGMGRATIDVKACNLLKQDKIRVRLEQLQERTARKCERTVESIDEMLQEAFEAAKGDDDRWPIPSAMTNAALGLAKLHGLIVEKREDVTKRPSRTVDARIDQLLDAARARGTGESRGREAREPEPREAVPTVSEYGTA